VQVFLESWLINPVPLATRESRKRLSSPGLRLCQTMQGDQLLSAPALVGKMPRSELLIEQTATNRLEQFNNSTDPPQKSVHSGVDGTTAPNSALVLDRLSRGSWQYPGLHDKR